MDDDYFNQIESEEDYDYMIYKNNENLKSSNIENIEVNNDNNNSNNLYNEENEAENMKSDINNRI